MRGPAPASQSAHWGARVPVPPTSPTKAEAMRVEDAGCTTVPPSRSLAMAEQRAMHCAVCTEQDKGTLKYLLSGIMSLFRYSQ